MTPSSWQTTQFSKISSSSTSKLFMCHGKDRNLLAEAIDYYSCSILVKRARCLFLLSFLGPASIDCLSLNGAALIASHEARIRATSPETWGHGIAEQYALQLDKLHAGTASTVIGSMPVYLSHPSGSTSLPSILSFPTLRADTE